MTKYSDKPLKQMMRVTASSVIIYNQLPKKPKKNETSKTTNNSNTDIDTIIDNNLSYDLFNALANGDYFHYSIDSGNAGNTHTDIQPEQKEIENRFLSPRTKRKIRDRITQYFYHMKYKKTFNDLTFWTLTLTEQQKHTDYEVNNMLNTLLTRLRKKYSDLEYIWVAERQTKSTNNIHYHIIFNKTMPIMMVNYYWCKILENKKYKVTCPKPYIVKNGQREYLKKPTKECYYESKGCSNPVDVQKVYSADGLAAYLTKYITKNKSEIQGSTWNCSQYYSSLITTYTTEFNEDAKQKYTQILQNNSYICKKTKERVFIQPIEIYIDDGKTNQIGTYLHLVNSSIVESFIYNLNT